MDQLVTIIVASYNKATFISETINSVLKQSYSNWELLIIDDCSTDNTEEVISFFLKDSRIKLTKNSTNKGANFCRNYGIEQAKGEYIIFLDADDLLILGCLEERINAAVNDPGKNLLIFSMGVFDRKIGDNLNVWKPNSNEPLKDFLQHKLPWSILQPIWKRDLLVKLKGFDESFLRLQDVELNTRALLNENVNYKIIGGEPDCYYRVDEARKNYDTVNFLSRWIGSALKYYEKFYAPAKLLNKEKYLLGTIYETYLQIIFHFKTNKISKPEFKSLENELLNNKKIVGLNYFKRKAIGLAAFYNIYFFRIPGINRMFKQIIIS